MARATRAAVPPIVLELTDAEAEVVKYLVGAVFGAGEGRKLTDAVYDKLDRLNVAASPHGLSASVRS